MDKSKSALKESALSKGTKLKYGKKEYIIEKVLGIGGFGITYKAYSIEFDGNIKRKYYYAIKEYFQKGCWRENMKVCFADSFKVDYEEGFNDFKAEANKLLSLAGKSRNIVPVNECFQQNNTIYYIMEYLNGEDLDKIVPKGIGLPEAKALSLFIPILKAVKILHDNKSGDRIMHLDIKPDNIVLHQDPISDETYPVLIDFGAAMRFDKEGKPKTRKANIQGTTGFAPPEQFQPIEQFDARIDVYALGATLFYLLTGKQPKSSYDVSDSYIMESLPNNVSERTRNAIKNAMQKDKLNRLRNVQEFINAIEDSYYLPVFSVLSSPRQRYKILSVEDENEHSITYKGCINNSLDSNSSYSSEKNPTKVAYEYFIHEFYVRGVCKRTGVNVTMAPSQQTEDSYQHFMSDVNNAGITDYQPCIKADNGIVEKELFAANGTYYYCTRIKKPTPVPPIYRLIRLAAVFLTVMLAVLAFMNLDNISDYLKGLIPTESEKLTKAIECQNFNSLKKFADRDSVRAYEPLAKIFITDKKDTLNAYQLYKKISDNVAIKQIEDALMEHFNESISSLLKQYDKADNSVKDNYLIDAIKISDKGKAVASNYGFLYNRLDLSNTVDKRFDEWVKAGDKINLRETKIYNYQHALRLKEDSYVRNKLDALLAVQSSQTTSQQLSQPSSNQSTTQSVSVSPNTIEITDDQKYEIAIKNNNWNDLKKLADKGYSKAYIPLAKHYLRSSSTHSQAESYALKAVNVDKGEAKNIIDILESYGYYDDKRKPLIY